MRCPACGAEEVAVHEADTYTSTYCQNCGHEDKTEHPRRAVKKTAASPTREEYRPRPKRKQR